MTESPILALQQQRLLLEIEYHADKAELDWALRHVENKKGALACYARGADLFRKFGNDPDLCEKMLKEYPSRVEPGY